MEITEISLVDEPANSDATVVIVKAKRAPPPEAAGMTMAGVAKAVRAALAEMAPQVAARALAGGDPAATPDAEGAAQAILTETIMDLEQLTKALEDAEGKIEALEKRAADAEAAVAERDAEIEKAKAAAPPAEEDVLKSLPEPIRKRLEEAEEGVRKLREERELEGAIAKAKSLGFGKPAEIGPLLLRVQKGATTPEDAARIEAVLKQAAVADRESPLFKSVGSGLADDADPDAVIKGKADEIRKSNPALTEAQAFDLALQANPRLYDAAIAKQRSRAAAA
jgi:hypothetical protein